MISTLILLLAATADTAGGTAPAPARADTIRIEIGSREVDGRVYKPHAARVRVRIGADDAPPVAEWTNELTLGDSAGRPIMRWVTKGTRVSPSGAPVTWELRQTYDAVTLAPYGHVARSSAGTSSQLSIDGRRVRGTKRSAGDSTVQPVDLTLDRPGFVASASDLVPLAVGLKAGTVMIAPVWNAGTTQTESRIFSVIGKTPITVEGTAVNPWKVEERRHADGKLVATWYLLETSPYMVYGEVVLPDGRIQRMSEVEVERTVDGRR